MKVTIELRGQKSALNTEPVYLRFNHYDSKLFKGQLRFRYKTSYKIEKGADILKSLPNPIRHNLENCIKEVESDFNNRIDFVPTESWFIKTCSDFLNSKKRNGFLLDLPRPYPRVDEMIYPNSISPLIILTSHPNHQNKLMRCGTQSWRHRSLSRNQVYFLNLLIS